MGIQIPRFCWVHSVYPRSIPGSTKNGSKLVEKYNILYNKYKKYFFIDIHMHTVIWGRGELGNPLTVPDFHHAGDLDPGPGMRLVNRVPQLGGAHHHAYLRMSGIMISCG